MEKNLKNAIFCAIKYRQKITHIGLLSLFTNKDEEDVLQCIENLIEEGKIKKKDFYTEKEQIISLVNYRAIRVTNQISLDI
jgi:hypothetical protein